MPLILNRNRIPGRREPQERWQIPASRCIRIGIINNMPDAALEDTEDQFFSLLEAAAGDLPVCVGLYSLPEITRGEHAQCHIHDFYSNLDDLPNDQLDAVIITGAEPREQDLRKESYWQTLADLMDWAERETVSTVLSCLATHASVLHSDGIERQRLREKRFGVFDETKACDHRLIAGVPPVVQIPHSRWNELREEDLVSCGYVVLTRSQKAGVGLFAKQKRKSLFLCSQGHPEYSTPSLLKEYRRDVKRFIGGERETYPETPNKYFDAPTAAILANFQQQLLANPSEDLLSSFPYDAIAEGLQNGWHAVGTEIYRNWLSYIHSRKNGIAKPSVLPAFYERTQRARSAVSSHGRG